LFADLVQPVMARLAASSGRPATDDLPTLPSLIVVHAREA
jgi:hypothetical protein